MIRPHKNNGHELFLEALAEDKREGGRFDAIGFAQFFPEDHIDDVRDAWRRYLEHHYRQPARGGK